MNDIEELSKFTRYFTYLDWCEEQGYSKLLFKEWIMYDAILNVKFSPV